MVFVEAAQGATSNVANQFMLNVIDKEIGGEDVSLDRDLLYAAGTGAPWALFAAPERPAMRPRLYSAQL
jgi:hypothetical protein